MVIGLRSFAAVGSFNGYMKGKQTVNFTSQYAMEQSSNSVNLVFELSIGD